MTTRQAQQVYSLTGTIKILTRKIAEKQKHIESAEKSCNEWRRKYNDARAELTDRETITKFETHMENQDISTTKCILIFLIFLATVINCYIVFR